MKIVENDDFPENFDIPDIWKILKKNFEKIIKKVVPLKKLFGTTFLMTLIVAWCEKIDRAFRETWHSNGDLHWKFRPFLR